jgi:CMP-2-keto-3-deoxyoctulosonic acid synthetase
VADAIEAPGPGVDTAEDLARVEALIRRGGRS